MKNIRKIISIALVAILAMSFVGCNNDNDSKDITENLTVNITDDALENSETFMGFLESYNADGMYAMTSENFKSVIEKEEVEKQNKSLKKKLGNLKSYDNFRVVQESGYKNILVYSEFEKGTYDFKIAFSEDNRSIEGYSLQESVLDGESVDTENYNGEGVSFGSEKYKANGTLLLPKNQEQKSPAIILVHGSGSNDRDETINGINKPFKDLAEGLADEGIAVLRYDKRTYSYGTNLTTEEIASITPEFEIIEDVVAAVDYLESRDDIDSENIFVLGHSLSGYLIPYIYEKAPSIKGAISLAGTIHGPFEDLMKSQYEYLANFDGEVSVEEQGALDDFNTSYEMVKQLKRGESVNSNLILGVGQPYWHFFNNYDGLNKWDEITKPTLVLQGERDYQLPMEHFQQYKEKFDSKENFDFKSYKKLTHIFMNGAAKPSPSDYMSKGNVDKEVVEDISTWIKTQ